MACKVKYYLPLTVIMASLLSAIVQGYPIPMVDMSYGYNNITPTYYTHKRFNITRNESISLPNGLRFQTADFESGEHAGTHMDAPFHMYPGKMPIDQIPLERFDGPGVVINITEKASKDPDAQVTVQDVKDWEKRNGKIQNGSIVLMNSGWTKYWNNPKKYFGGEELGKMHFPGFSLEACKFLTQQRGVFGFGSDTVSVDYGQSHDVPCHKQILVEANGFILENVANVQLLPESGSTIRAFPMKIVGGTGAPTRVIAYLPNPRKN